MDWKVIDWPLEERRCPVLIYERPRGKRVIDSIETALLQSHLKTVLYKNFIKPVFCASRN